MRNRSPIRVTALAAVLCLGMATAQATVWRWNAVLDDDQAGQLAAGTSNPNNDPARPDSSGGSGIGFGTYDDVTKVMTWEFTITGLGSAATVAHFHFGAPGVFRGPIRLETPSLDIGALAGATSGSFSGSQNFGDSFTPGLPLGGIAQLESELLGGNWYLNIHTTNFAAGEIRGQINIPEPGSLALFAVGLLGAAAWRRRRS